MFYVPSQNVVLLTFVLMGAAFGFLWRSAQKEGDMEEVRSTRGAILLRSVFAAACIVLLLLSTIIVTRRAFAEALTVQGEVALAAGQTDAAFARANEAAWFETTPNVTFLRLAAGYIKLQQIAGDTSLPAETAQERFTSTLTSTLDTGRQAVALGQDTYRSYLLIGNIYALLDSLKIEGAYNNALQAYTLAAERNPKSPAIPLTLARLEASKGNTALAEEAVTKSLTLKSDYTDAILFVVQLAVEREDLPNAIRAATAAVQTAPGVSSIWFQLGLLYYTTKDMKNAITALEQALELTPTYANAKYFLGLAYYSENRTQEATALFEDLQKTNPDNAEVQLILSNIRFGKQPFDGAQPPATSPEDRTTAPVVQ